MAVIGTPRSGNTWLRRVLATGYGLELGRGERAVHDLSQGEWESDPPYIVQVHTRYRAEDAAGLARAGVRVIVPKRHPFDVLISILQYVRHQYPESARWLSGEGGTEASIVGLSPTDPGFLTYARSERAKALLDVSALWSRADGAIQVRYEDLIAEPIPTLMSLAESVGDDPATCWEAALAANTMDRLNATHGRGHIWQGRPGLWRSLLTSEVVAALSEVHLPLLREQPGASPADPNLTARQANANWEALTNPAG